MAGGAIDRGIAFTTDTAAASGSPPTPRGAIGTCGTAVASRCPSSGVASRGAWTGLAAAGRTVGGAVRCGAESGRQRKPPTAATPASRAAAIQVPLAGVCCTATDAYFANRWKSRASSGCPYSVLGARTEPLLTPPVIEFTGTTVMAPLRTFSSKTVHTLLVPVQPLAGGV